MEVSIDLADAIQQALNEEGHNASASPLPADFDSLLPYSRIQTLDGGYRSDVVVDTRTVLVETWAADMEAAVAECAAVVARIVELQGTGERSTFSRVQLIELLDMGEAAIAQLLELQNLVTGFCN